MGGQIVPRLWEQPGLTIAIFEVQFTSPEGGRLYEESGITPELLATLRGTDGLLHTRVLTTPNGRMLLQYWASFAQLHAFSRAMPHMAWWKWLLQHADQGVCFHHEVYQAATAEAIYSPGTPAVGPAAFCGTDEVGGKDGDGRSAERQRRFAEAVAARNAS